MSDKKIFPDFKQTLAGSTGKNRKLYTKPQLEALGDLRTLTLGGSPGTGDSSVGDPEYPPV